MKKKLLMLFMALIAALCLCFGLAACGEEEDKSANNNTQTEQGGGNTPTPHVHSYGNWEVIAPATHTTTGTRRKYCSCGEHIDEIIPKTTTHTFLPYSHTDATCTEAGEDVLRCECGEEQRTTIPPSHTYDHCECTVCGAIKPGAVAVGVYVDGRLYDTVYTDAEYGYKIELPTVPPDWTVDKSILCYFDGWYTDKDYTTLATGNEVYHAPSAIYGQQYINDKWSCDCTFSNNEATITKVNLNYGTTIFIPRYINTFPVTGIAANAFKGQTTIRYLFLSDTVRTIGASAFAGCNSMLKVFFSEGITSIGDYAFMDCSGLTEVYITDLAAWCKIDFGSGSANPLYCASHLYLDGEEVKNLTIPAEITEIKPYAFYGCSGLTGELKIPDNVTSIGLSAFYNCNGLTGELKIPDDVTSIEYGAFYNCSGLESVTIGSGVTSIGDDAFGYCSGLESVIWNAENCIEAGSYRTIFEGCTNLKTVTVGNNVKTIPAYAFHGCSGLTGVYISDLVAWCAIDFGNVDANPLLYAEHLYWNEEEVKNLTIPDEVMEIKQYAFRWCSGLESVTIGRGVTSIGDDAFGYCSGLESVVWNAENCTKAARPASGYNYNSNFYGCNNLRSVTFGENVKKIPSFAFSGCNGLKSVTIGSGVTSIGDCAFSGCGIIENVIWNAKHSSVGIYNQYVYPSDPDHTIFRYTKLETVIFGENVEYIPSFVFYGCEVSSVIICGSVTSIGYGAFYNSGQKTVYYKGTPSQWASIQIADENGSIATRYYYSAQMPSAEQWAESPNWWHYEADGKTIALWTKEQA